MNINPFEILKNAQKIQEQMGSMQEKLKDIKVTGSSGGGMVEVEMNANMEMLAVHISPDALEGNDTDMLEDLIIAAYNMTIEKVKDTLNREMGMFAGLNFPSGN